MPVLSIALEELKAALGVEIEAERMIEELHRFGCEVEGRVSMQRVRCPACGALSESPVGSSPPLICDGCGLDFRERAAVSAGSSDTLKIEFLPVRPDLFDPSGLARAMAGFLGLRSGAPGYRVGAGMFRVRVDADVGEKAGRPRIACAVVRGIAFRDATLRSLMTLQENIHWALGRDRKLASIGVYDLSRVSGQVLRYRAVAKDGVRFVPLGVDPTRAGAAMTPAEILSRHPKGTAFASLVEANSHAPLLEDENGGVLSMPPIINSEATRVTAASRDLFVDVTGLDDRQIDRALAIIVTSLLESNPDAAVETVAIEYEGGEARRTPDLAPQIVPLDPRETCALIGIEAAPGEVAELLRRMRHDVDVAGDADANRLLVAVPAYRADVMHPRDLIEDVAVAYGYDRITARLTTAATFGDADPVAELHAAVRRTMIGLGLLEVMTLPLSNEEATFTHARLPRTGDHVTLQNPISVDQTMLRISTLPGLLGTLALNLSHPYPQRLFEVGLCSRVDAEAETGAREFSVCSAAFAGDRLGYADIRAVADVLLSSLEPGAGDTAGAWELRPSTAEIFIPGRGAEVFRDGRWRGRLGEVSPHVLEHHRIVHPVAVMEILLDE